MPGGNGDVYEPPELTRAVRRVEQAVDTLTGKVDQNNVALNSEIRDVRHRVANVEAWKDLTAYTIQTMREDMKENESRQLKVNEEVISALEPINTFLAEQAGIEKWKRAAMALAGLIVAIVGILAGVIWAG